MDLLFKRYANPFLIIDQMILVGRFGDFLLELIDIVDEETTWEFYLHTDMLKDKSFEEFKQSLTEAPENNPMTDNMIETTINKTYDILEGFTPENL